MSRRAGVPTDHPPVRCGAATATGHRRPRNEDAVVTGPHWYAVADGMGGHRAGDVASRVAVEAIGRAAPARTVADVERVFAAANAAVFVRARRHAGMGATIVGVTRLVDGRAVVFHAGDARCYRLLDGALDLVTTDHSYVQELVSAGLLAAADAPGHPMRNVVTRALGLDPDAVPELAVLDRPGRLLLCSDGLSAELDPPAIGRILAAVADPRRAAERLVALALEGPARDNVTALVVDLSGAEGESVR